MRFLHLVDGIFKRRGINPFRQFHKSDVTVVTEPVVKAPRAHRLNGKDNLRMNGAVLREVFINSTDSQLQFRHLLIGYLFANRLVDSTEFLSESP